MMAELFINESTKRVHRRAEGRSFESDNLDAVQRSTIVPDTEQARSYYFFQAGYQQCLRCWRLPTPPANDAEALAYRAGRGEG